MNLLPFLLLIAATSLAQAPSASIIPDAVYLNGHILTGERLQSDSPTYVEAIAIKDGKILRTGSSAELSKLIPAAQAPHLVNLNGAFVMPGFNDAHVHLGAAGQTKLNIDLTGTGSLADMQKRIQLGATATPGTQWLIGDGWDHTLWDSKVLPTRADLDAVTGGHPAIFGRIDGHIAVANSAALATAGITKATADPQGGKIDHGSDGEVTGILREQPAMSLVQRHIPPPSEQMRQRGLELAMADAVAHGVTSAQDNSDWEDFLVMETMEKEGKLPLRISEWLAFNAPIETLKAHRDAHSAADAMLHTTMLKGFMDGSLGSRTAALKAPYSDDPGNSGLPRYTQEQLNKLAVDRAEASFQLGFHAIGDRAVSMALEAFQQAVEARHKVLASILPSLRKNVHATVTVTDNPRYRIEHAQVVDPADIPRFRQLGVIASMQPSHLLTDMNWAEDRLGPARSKYSYTWKQFLDAGVHLAFGTDYPVEPVTPFRGIYSAVTRMNESGTKSYHPEDRLTIWQAIAAYTQGSAYAERTEETKGILASGYVADFIVLDRDITRIPPPQILKTQVLKTIVNGRVVFTAGIQLR